MQLVLQCLRHLNREGRGRCHPFQGLDATRRAASSVPRTPCMDSRCDAPTGLSSPPVPDIPSTKFNAITDHGPLSSLRARLANRSPKSPSKGRQPNDDYAANGWCPKGANLPPIDVPENEDDITLWHDLLHATKREHGQPGVLAVWHAVERRKNLYEAEGENAEAFWNAVLGAALNDESWLDRVTSYAEWMFDVHSVRWPHLYSTTISFYLRNSHYRRAMQWHMRLVPKFDPGSEVFSGLLRQFVTITDTNLQQTLQSLYVSTFHHSLYDNIIPLLFDNGASRLCAEWRELFLQFHDFPQLTAESQPYLRFLVRYYPGTSLALEEQMVLDVNSSTYWDVKDNSLWDAMKSTYGEDDGPIGRQYSDKLGARWFASSWIPLDFAIHAVHALGVHQIGPLSLQSIALREPTPDGVMARIEQLRKVNIGIGRSTYALAVRHFAETADHELLDDLLHTDIHPDVFDDPQILQSIRDEASTSGAWQTHRLLLAIQPAIAQESIELTSNLLLHQRLEQRQNKQALALLDDMRSMNIELSEASVGRICSTVFESLPWNPKVEPANWRNLQEAIAFLNRLMLLQKPLPARYWQKALFGLGRFGRLDELEDLCLGVLDTYQARNAPQGGLLPVHPMDAPPSKVGGLGEKIVIPTDLPVAHTYNPMRQIFDKSALHIAIIRWGFKAGMSNDLVQWSPDAARAAKGSITRGVQLLAKLEERGIPLNTSTVRKEVIRCLIILYRPRVGRARVLPELAVVREQINEAAGMASGRQLLPSVPVLRDLITRDHGQRRRRNHLK